MRKLIQMILGKAGYRLGRLRDVPAEVLIAQNIDLVLDVGANAGQYALEIRSFGYPGRIVSFEPLSSAHKALTSAAAADKNWDVFERCALGAEDTMAAINISQNSLSSSIFNILDAHTAAVQESGYVDKENVRIVPLDKVFGAVRKNSKRVFLKIDTQGYESKVLDGAIETLPALQGIQIELSTVPLYEGQDIYFNIVNRLESLGFSLWALVPFFTDPVTGRLLQFDGIFISNK